LCGNEAAAAFDGIGKRVMACMRVRLAGSKSKEERGFDSALRRWALSSGLLVQQYTLKVVGAAAHSETLELGAWSFDQAEV
jgi:hypothetical protein